MRPSSPEITDGRYTSLEIDDNYNLLVLDEGEEKPVISGGEEDVTNLVLRLAISQMIAERAGHPLSLLILDEVLAPSTSSAVTTCPAPAPPRATASSRSS